MPSLADIAKRFGGDVRGDPSVVIDGVGSLSGATEVQIAFYESDSHRAELDVCRAGAVLVGAQHEDATDKPRWVVPKSPRLHFARLAQWLEHSGSCHASSTAFAAGSLSGDPETAVGISPSAQVAADAAVGNNTHVGAMAVVESGVVLGDNVVIGSGAVVGAGARIGDGTVLMARSSVERRVIIGRDCVIHSGAVIGSDGFGFVRDETGAHVKVPQLGNVRLGDGVEVGANSAIDRGALDDTIIEDGVKIDNLVQIGHNVRIGKHTVICGCVGIAGSVVIGKNCNIGGGAGIAGHLSIGDGASVAARSEVTREVPAGEVVSSVMPALPARKWRRFVGALRILAERSIK